ncbi:MAG TPA: hypothetical protein VN963_03660, partial [bacterium]|nr:hypothetical protein [bacterium]
QIKNLSHPLYDEKIAKIRVSYHICISPQKSGRRSSTALPGHLTGLLIAAHWYARPTPKIKKEFLRELA